MRSGFRDRRSRANLINMQTEVTEAVASQPIIIGRIIEAELRSQGRSVAWLSRELNCNRRNIYSIFERRYIDTDLLFRISIALRRDFFSFYSEMLNKEILTLK